jgi:DNA-binding CsgD family transcriptional regulator
MLKYRLQSFSRLAAGARILNDYRNFLRWKFSMDPSNKLSDREWEVVKLLQQGKSNKLIASSLGISERTVEFHLKNIFDKFQVSSRVELIIKLGESTVAAKAENAENRDRLNLSNLSTSFREAASRIGKELKMENLMDSNARSASSTMSFFESIIVCLKKYAEFNGRASRSEFWWFALSVILVASAFTYLSQALANVFLIAVLLPFLAAGSRRLHDTGKSGWWQLFILAPIGGIVLCGFLWAKPTMSSLPDDTLPA